MVSFSENRVQGRLNPKSSILRLATFWDGCSLTTSISCSFVIQLWGTIPPKRAQVQHVEEVRKKSKTILEVTDIFGMSFPSSLPAGGISNLDFSLSRYSPEIQQQTSWGLLLFAARFCNVLPTQRLVQTPGLDRHYGVDHWGDSRRGETFEVFQDREKRSKFIRIISHYVDHLKMNM